MNKDFAVFILTHGRANKVDTYNTLIKQGYTGRIILVCDDADEELPIYQKKYKDVEVFNKLEAREYTDDGDNFGNMNCVVYARNYAPRLAKKLGLKYYLVLDDDYSVFMFMFNKNGEYKGQIKKQHIKNLDKVFEAFINLLKNTNIDCVATLQSGDLIGGKESQFVKNRHKKRKIMNTFFCRTDRPFEFMGKINEDVNCYVVGGQQGKIFFQLPEILVHQKTTQQNKGGLTDIYLNMGTYVKSFYSVMYAPSCVKISTLGTSNKRIHHQVEWDYCVPRILEEKYKKAV